MAGNELIGMMFTTPKELRHLAEQHFGELFVPTEVVAQGRSAAIIALRPTRGRLVVRAARAGDRTPYRITSAEWDGEGRRIA